jgi:aconitate hydratase
MMSEPLGQDEQGSDVFLKDIWPTTEEIEDAMQEFVTPQMFKEQYADVFTGDENWRNISVSGGDVYEWKDDSTYIQEPPFFVGLEPEPQPIRPIKDARCLVMVGDSVTTDHISPAGVIPVDSPAGQYLMGRGVEEQEFNSYGSRRGNDRVMTRGTFGNVRLRNLLAPGTEGGYTTYLPKGEQTTVFAAAERYKESGTPLIVLAGEDYGMGSSRDWAAKGTYLLGVRAVIAKSFERIHRTNLVCMGVLPFVFQKGEDRESLGLTGHELFDFPDLNDDLKPRQEVKVVARDPESEKRTDFKVIARIDTPVEVDYFRNSGVLQTVLRKMLKEA